MTDARFQDGDAGPLALIAQDAADLGVISAFVQDAVFPAPEMRFRPKARQFALMLNRFRWEDREAAARAQRPYERVQAVLSFQDVLSVRSQGINRADKDLILSVLAISFQPGPEGTGEVLLTLAGDGAIALQVETLDVTLKDVTRPYRAVSGKMPDHGL